MTDNEAVLDRLDRIIRLLERVASAVDPRTTVVADSGPPPKAQVKFPEPKPRGTHASAYERPPASRKRDSIPELDAYHYVQGAKVVRLLLREDVRPVGRVVRSISEELGLGRSSTERLLRVLIQTLPFMSVTKSGGTTGAFHRIAPNATEQAMEWLRKADQIGSQPKTLSDTRGVSDLAFFTKGALMVEALLQNPGGILTHDLMLQTDTNSTTGRAILARLSNLPKPFIYIEIAPRGKASLVRISDAHLAQVWLRTETNSGRQSTHPPN